MAVCGWSWRIGIRAHSLHNTATAVPLCSLERMNRYVGMDCFLARIGLRSIFTAVSRLYQPRDHSRSGQGGGGQRYKPRYVQRHQQNWQDRGKRLGPSVPVDQADLSRLYQPRDHSHSGQGSGGQRYKPRYVQRHQQNWQDKGKQLGPSVPVDQADRKLIWEGYKRNHKGAIPPAKTRLKCKRGPTKVSNPCPICKNDIEIQYMDTNLLEQFICPHTGQILEATKTGLCRQQQKKLVAAIEKARDHGYLVFNIPRKFSEEGIRIPPWNKIDVL